MKSHIAEEFQARLAILLHLLASLRETSRPDFHRLPVLIQAMGFQAFGRVSNRFGGLEEYFSKKLQSAYLKSFADVYISNMLFWSVICSTSSGVLAVYLISSFPLNLEAFTLPIGGIAAALTGLGVLGAFTLYPLYRAGLVKRRIEANLPYAVSYIGILSSSGATIEQIFESLSGVKDVYGVKESTKRIIRNIQLLGTDIFSALDDESKKNPSKRFAELLQGFIATARSGGSVTNYFATAASKQVEERKHDIRKVIDNLSLIGEVYIAALVALPIVLVTILTISGLFGGEIFPGFGAALLLQLIVYFMIPVLAMAVLLMIDAVASRTGW